MVILGAIKKMASFSFFWHKGSPHLQSLPLERDRYFPATQKPPWMATEAEVVVLRSGGVDSILSIQGLDIDINNICVFIQIKETSNYVNVSSIWSERKRTLSGIANWGPKIGRAHV